MHSIIHNEKVAVPAVFISHGSPMTALDSGPFSAALAKFGAEVRPRAVVVVSGHWEERGAARVSSAAHPEMIYDFYGFPPELYAVKYPAPGEPSLAARVAGLLHTGLDSQRGFDHGTWVPLRLMYPDAGIPVVQVSLPVPRSPRDLYEIGRALGPLLDDDVMILGSGGITHNLFMQRPAAWAAPPEPWAVAFDEWVAVALAARDTEALFAYAQQAPYARQAVPTPDHFDPLFVVLGAAGDYGVRDIYRGFQMSHFSLRSFALAPAH